MGNEEGVVEFKSPDSRLAAYPTEAGVLVTEGSGSRGACGRGEVGLYRGVTNSGPGTRTLGTCSGNVDELVFFSTISVILAPKSQSFQTLLKGLARRARGVGEGKVGDHAKVGG